MQSKPRTTATLTRPNALTSTVSAIRLWPHLSVWKP